MIRKQPLLLLAPVVLAASMSTPALSADKLTYYCSAQEDWCQLMATGFEEATGIEVAMTRKSSGETYAQIKAESSNPKGDIWWGGTGDPHLQAAEEGLFGRLNNQSLLAIKRLEFIRAPWVMATMKTY